MKTKVTFLGLGVMGFNMASHLAQSESIELKVYNRSLSKVEQFTQKYPHTLGFSQPDLAVESSDFVLACLGDDLSLKDTLLSNSVMSSLKKGAIVIDHTTASSHIAQTIGQAYEARGVHFLDAPVTGGQAGAENGSLTILCGGEPFVYQQAKPLLSHYAKTIEHFGGVGRGQLAKMVNQICIAGLLQGLSEGVYFAQKCGLDGHQLFKTLKNGAAGSWQMENRYQWMVDDSFQPNEGFAVDWMIKDLKLCLDQAQSLGIELALTPTILKFYQKLSKKGKGRLDTASLVLNLN